MSTHVDTGIRASIPLEQYENTCKKCKNPAMHQVVLKTQRVIMVLNEQCEVYKQCRNREVCT